MVYCELLEAVSLGNMLVKFSRTGYPEVVSKFWITKRYFETKEDNNFLSSAEREVRLSEIKLLARLF